MAKICCVVSYSYNIAGTNQLRSQKRLLIQSHSLLQVMYGKSYLLRYSQALQPVEGLGRLKNAPPTISVPGLDPPVPKSQPLCIPHHSIYPSEVWPSRSPSTLR
jgi:hypothetical protein